MVAFTQPLRFCRTAAAAFAAMLLVGCPPVGETTFYNDTSQNLTVTWGEHVTSVPSHSSGIIRSFDLPEGLQVIGEKRSWRYHFRLLPDDFRRPIFDFGLRIKPNGDLFAVQPPAAAIRFHTQPPGYPLKPESGSGGAAGAAESLGSKMPETRVTNKASGDH